MEPEGPLPHSQKPATCPCPEPDQSSPSPQSNFFKIYFYIIPHLCLGLPSGPSSSGFSTKTLHGPLPFPMHATCPIHLILLDLITPLIAGKEYRLQSSLLCSLLYSPLTQSILGPNIFSSTVATNTVSLQPRVNVPPYINTLSPKFTFLSGLTINEPKKKKTDSTSQFMSMPFSQNTLIHSQKHSK